MLRRNSIVSGTVTLLHRSGGCASLFPRILHQLPVLQSGSRLSLGGGGQSSWLLPGLSGRGDVNPSLMVGSSLGCHFLLAQMPSCRFLNLLRRWSMSQGG